MDKEMQKALEADGEKLRQLTGEDHGPFSLERFDEASNHPYECKCKLCQEWWKLMPSEDD